MADKSEGCGCVLLIAAVLVVSMFSDSDDTVPVTEGDLSPSGGSPTIREPYEEQPDDPWTTNDESNDQPVGHFGTLTMSVSGVESGNFYTLDVELEGLEVRRIYFPRGGWIDFYSCELDEDLMGTCFDEESRSWVFYGSSDAALSWSVPDLEGDHAQESEDEEFQDPDDEDDY